MENKYLQVRKENFFTKFINFFRKILYKEETIEQDIIIDNKAADNKKSFINSIKLEHEEDPVLLNLQKEFENEEIELASLSDQEIEDLNLLYKRQIEELKKKLDNKKTELNIIKNRIKNYVTNE